MINLFEYQNRTSVGDAWNGLDDFLDDIWSKREKNAYHSETESEDAGKQRFLQFLHKSNEVKSNKYVGVIHYQGGRINLLPKIFYDTDRDYADNEVNQIQNHILWWLSYCRKIHFPNYRTSLGSAKSDFFEVLIFLFTKYTRELLGSTVYQQYEEVNRELPFIKGRLNTGRYIDQSLSRGEWQKLHCTYDAFEIDNEFNRIIKHVCTLLVNVTSNQDNKKNLTEILFILDEVIDETATAAQCDRISFNPMLSEFETVRDYCRLFLTNSISFDYKNDLKLFAFLLPMEYVFESFVFGFIEKEMSTVTVKSQRSDTYLDESRTFNLKPDLFIETENGALIADTKYKIVYSDESDPKKGISQSDIYQMLAYAVRFEVDQIILLYPDTIRGIKEQVAELTIKDALADDREISVKACQLPVLNRELLGRDLDTNTNLDVLFEPTKEILRTRLRDALVPRTDADEPSYHESQS